MKPGPLKSDDDWKKELTPEQFKVARQCGTEPPFTGKYWNLHDDGTYHCVCCNAKLFSSGTKFESGSGWPSFYAPSGHPTVVRTYGGATIVHAPSGARRIEVVR